MTSNIDKNQISVGFVVIAAIVIGLAMLAAARNYFGYATETDFLGVFINDAEKFLSGEPLAVRYHPPFFSIAVAVFQSVIGDWFTSGRILSVFSAAIVLVTSFLLYRSVLSAAAGWGAIAALVLSPVFVAYATFVTSDIFFLALFSTVLLLAHSGGRHSSMILWTAAGAVLGCALLTRTNALSLLMILAIPWLDTSMAVRRRAAFFGAAAGAALVPILLWLIYAAVTGSNAFPTEGTAVNLALTYFKPEGYAWADSVDFAEESFAGTWDVVARDPVHVATTYVKNLYRVFEKLLAPDALFAFPAAYFALPALVYAFFVRQSRWVVYIAAITLAQLLLVVLAVKSPRFFLFLVPLVGALGGEFIRKIYVMSADADVHPLFPKIGQAILAFLLGIGVVQSAVQSTATVFRDEAEVAEAVPFVQGNIDADAIIVSRKPLLAYYTGAKGVFMPKGDGIADLLDFLDHLSLTEAGPIYVYYGAQEHERRPEYSDLRDPVNLSNVIPPLSLVGQSRTKGVWSLYRYVGGRDRSVRKDREIYHFQSRVRDSGFSARNPWSLRIIGNLPSA